MPVNAGRDYRMAEGKRTVVYQDDDTGVSISVPFAVKYDVAERSVSASQGQFGFGDVVWELPADILEDEPTESGTIIDNEEGDSWKPVDVELNVLCNVWKCVCRRVQENTT